MIHKFFCLSPAKTMPSNWREFKWQFATGGFNSLQLATSMFAIAKNYGEFAWQASR
jgi:hypothetical protein